MTFRFAPSQMLFPVGILLISLTCTAYSAGAAESDAMDDAHTLSLLTDQFKSKIQPLFQQYCYRCHANGKHKGDIILDRYSTLAQIQADQRTWGTIADVLTQHTMPPEDKPQPTREQANEITRWVSQALSYCDCSGPREPGHVAIHRLNKNEYNNTIRDLVGVDFRPADDFPADDTGYGFDNIADVLSMSPLLAEKYLNAAEQVLQKATTPEDVTKPSKKRYSTQLLQATGGNVGGDLMVNGEVYGPHDFPADGDYEIRLQASQDPYGDEAARMVLKIDGQDLQSFDVTNRRGIPQAYTWRGHVDRGRHRIAAAYTNNDKGPKGDRNLYVTSIEIHGPYNAVAPPPLASEKLIFFVKPAGEVSEAAAARKVIERFATRAFRRPVRGDELEGLLGLYKESRAAGDSYESAVKVALEAALVSPHFLYRIELDPPAQLASAEAARNAPAHAVSDYELATRLSYFLWSSMPDNVLFDLAARNRLHEPAVLDAQVRRMLADPKSSALVSNFIGQWLEVRNLPEIFLDRKKFPNFDNRLRVAMKQEVELFFANLIHEDRSVLELIDADYTFLNARLAKHYGIQGISGDEFRKVMLTECGEAGERRGGVLEMAGVLTVTAMPTRTSPVKRGKFILDQILGTPPPPQPADVPALADKPQDRSAKSLRERFEQHRADPSCSVCHLRMDPIGFAFENFDATGAWRTTDNGFALDTSGKLPDGTQLQGAGDVKKVLLERKDQFVKNLATKLMTYALGRGVEYYDNCTIRDIAAATAKEDYRFSAMVIALVESDGFLSRKAYVAPKPAGDDEPDSPKTQRAEPGKN